MRPEFPFFCIIVFSVSKSVYTSWWISFGLHETANALHNCHAALIPPSFVPLDHLKSDPTTYRSRRLHDKARINGCRTFIILSQSRTGKVSVHCGQRCVLADGHDLCSGTPVGLTVAQQESAQDRLARLMPHSVSLTILASSSRSNSPSVLILLSRISKMRFRAS